MVGWKSRAYPSPSLAVDLSAWVDGARSLNNGKTADEQYQFWLRDRAILSPSWAGPSPQGERVIDQTYSQYKDRERSPWLYGIPSQVLRNRTVEHHMAWQNHFRDPRKVRVPTFQAKGERDTVWLTQELFRSLDPPACMQAGGVKAVRKRWLTLELGTETNPVGLLRVRLHRPKPGHPVVVPDFDSIHLRRLAWGGWLLSGTYEDGALEVPLEAVVAQVAALDPVARTAAVKGVDRGVEVPLALSDGRLLDLEARAKARIAFLEGKIGHLQRRLARQKKGSKRRLATKGTIAKLFAERARLVDEFLCQAAAQVAREADLLLVAFEGLNLKAMTSKPKAKWDPARGRYLPNRAKAKAGLNRAFLRVAPGKTKQRFGHALSRRGKGLLDVTAAYSSQECSVCHHVDPRNRTQRAFLCVQCGHRDHADTNAAKVVQQRALRAIEAGAVASKPVKVMVTGRKQGRKKARLAQASVAVVPGAVPDAIAALTTAGMADQARLDGGRHEAPTQLGIPAEGAERIHPRGKGRKTGGAQAPDAALGKRETSSFAQPRKPGMDRAG